MIIHKGGCHCGAVSFEFDAPPDVTVLDCNCSVCRLVLYQHLIIAARQFRLLSGADNLVSYTFNTGVAQHLFCATCGIKSFYVPRSNPDGISVNFRCVDTSSFERVTFDDFDGVNWEANGSSLSHLSR